MSDRIAIGLDNAAFNGRLRKARPSFAVPVKSQPQSAITDVNTQEDVALSPAPLPEPLVEPAQSAPTPLAPTPASFAPASPVISEMLPGATATVPVMPAEPYAKPARDRLQPSAVLMRPAYPVTTEQPDDGAIDELFDELPMQQTIAANEPATSVQESPTPEPTSQTRGGGKRSAGVLPKAMFGVACLVFVVGLGVSIRTQQTNQSAAAQFAALTEEIRSQSGRASASSSTPRSAAQTAAASPAVSAVADDEPSTIQIPKINLDTKVQAVALTDQGKLQLPSDFRSAGWYSASAKPGQPGAMVVHGQMSAGSTYGPFHRASELVAGDTITVIRGDQASVVYRVSGIQQLSANQDSLSAAKVPQTAGKNGLNIIATAPGSANPIIVSAEQQ